VTHRLPPTEAENPQSAGLDLLTTPALVELLIADQRSAVDAALAQTPVIARAVDEIARRLSRGGRLHYVGAGSSGRIATLDASEMPPTFGTPPEMVQAHIAGGTTALTTAVEGAEDDASAGDVAMLGCVRPGDVVLGISASGAAAFVVAAIARARTIGAYTIALTVDAQSALAGAAELAIVPPTGAEALAGSTRLKAGTAQKVALNAISTAVMVRLGKVYDNLMVDVVANNDKLRARALRLVVRLAQVNEERAEELLAQAGGSVKIAVLMGRRSVGATQARALLERNDGALRRLL
jgi:N-acetylmuramic acid 6-phosphate etherase